jgi:ribosomal protein L12E/L44/L45/RPP1/RPP2
VLEAIAKIRSRFFTLHWEDVCVGNMVSLHMKDKAKAPAAFACDTRTAGAAEDKEKRRRKEEKEEKEEKEKDRPVGPVRRLRILVRFGP